MSRAAAVFDVDRTLVRGHTERLFFWYLVRCGHLKIKDALAFLGRLAAHPHHRHQDKSYLRGLAVAETVRLARECYDRLIAPRVSSVALAQIRQHRKQGHEIVLLTGSLAFLMLPLKDAVGADWLIATELEEKDHCFTGKIVGSHPRGRNKRLLLEHLSRQQGFDLSRSYAYGDHGEDLAVFQMVGHPVAVNPSWRLRRLARQRHWPIRFF